VNIDLKNVPTLQQIQCYRAKLECQYFIENFVKIEDRDSIEIAVPFKLWETDCGEFQNQVDALNTFLIERLIICYKARQLGFTWLALAYETHKEIYTPGWVVVALSKREEDAKELVRRITFILSNLPDYIVIDKKNFKGNWDDKGHPISPVPVWESTALSIVIYHPQIKTIDEDGEEKLLPCEPSMFRSLSASPDSGRSLTANSVLIDEWAFQEYARDIWDAAYPTINRSTGGQVIGLSTIKRGTLFEEIWDGAVAGTNGFTPVFAPWYLDPKRGDEWREATKKAMPNTYRSEYPSTPEEGKTIGKGAFFEEWDEEIHIPTKHWTPSKRDPGYIIAAYDPGFSSYACFKWYFVFNNGQIKCFREYYPHRVTDKNQALDILKMSCYDDGIINKVKCPNGLEIEVPGTPYRFNDIVADCDAWTPNRGTGETTSEVFAKYGIMMRQADKNLENGWRRLHEWLEPFPDKDGKMMALLTFTTDCQNTRRTYPSCISSKINPEDIDKSCESHCQDVDRYMTMSRPEPNFTPETDNERKLSEVEQKFGKGSMEYTIAQDMFGEIKTKDIYDFL
jgi:hypothetical protein